MEEERRGVTLAEVRDARAVAEAEVRLRPRGALDFADGRVSP